MIDLIILSALWFAIGVVAGAVCSFNRLEDDE